jgi:hypothetical protein
LLGSAASIALGGVEKGGKTGAVELIKDFGETGNFGGLDFSEEIGEPGDEFEFQLVNLELFVIELAASRHGEGRWRFGDGEQGRRSRSKRRRKISCGAKGSRTNESG